MSIDPSWLFCEDFIYDENTNLDSLQVTVYYRQKKRSYRILRGCKARVIYTTANKVIHCAILLIMVL